MNAPTHIAQVVVQTEGDIRKVGTPVFYDGPPDWKFMPIDPAAQKEWAETVADPDRAKEDNWWSAGRPIDCPSQSGADLASENGQARCRVGHAGRLVF